MNVADGGDTSVASRLTSAAATAGCSAARTMQRYARRYATWAEALSKYRTVGGAALVTDREAGWDERHATTPPGWQVGRPTYRVEQRQWALYAWRPESKLRVGKRTEEWTAVAPTEEAAVREMARCLALIKAGNVPK
jgi:hypothetical protein